MVKSVRSEQRAQRNSKIRKKKKKKRTATNRLQTKVVAYVVQLWLEARQVELADHHRYDAYEVGGRGGDVRLVDDQVVVDVAVEALADLEAEEEAETDHDKEGHELERVLYGLAKGDYVAAEAEELHVLEEERQANPRVEDGERADGDAHAVVEARYEREDGDEERRELEPVVHGREVADEAVADQLEELLAQVDEHHDEQRGVHDVEQSGRHAQVEQTDVIDDERAVGGARHVEQHLVAHHELLSDCLCVAHQEQVASRRTRR